MRPNERPLGTRGSSCQTPRSAPRRTSSTGSSSGSPATPATGCSSPATASPAPARCSATTWPRCRTSRPRSARPAGTLAGVSGFQVHISDHDITTPGDAPNVLVAMNPAALRSELGKLEPGGTLIVNVDTFDERNLAKAGYDDEPARRRQPQGLHGLRGADDALTKEACEPLGVKPRDADRSKNFFALGLISWMYTRPDQPTIDWIDAEVREPRRRSATPTWPRSRPGTPSARRPSCSTTPTRCSPRRSAPGTYTNINGNTALAWGLIAAGQLSNLPMFLGLLPDHPGVGHPPRAVEAQELRGAHAAGRGRDRRHRRRPRRRLRRPPRRAPPPAVRAWPSRPRPSAWPSASSCRC